MTSPYSRAVLRAPDETRGPGVAALTLGVLALLTFWMCGLGMLLAVIGLCYGAYAVARDRGRSFGLAGIAFSILALTVASAALLWFGRQAADCTGHYRTYFDRSSCMDAKFPLLKAHLGERSERSGAAGG